MRPTATTANSWLTTVQLIAPNFSMKTWARLPRMRKSASVQNTAAAENTEAPISTRAGIRRRPGSARRRATAALPRNPPAIHGASRSRPTYSKAEYSGLASSAPNGKPSPPKAQ